MGIRSRVARGVVGWSAWRQAIRLTAVILGIQLTLGLAPAPATPASAAGTALCSVTPGSSADSGLLLRGTVLAPQGVISAGEVLIDQQGILRCVASDCSGHIAFEGSTLVDCPGAVVSPALINAHDHLLYDHLYPANWGEERFDQRHDWRKGLRGHTQISAPSNNDPDVVAWTELRQILAGTTSLASAGAGVPGLLRNLDLTDALTEGLTPYLLSNTTFPLADSDGVQLESTCRYPEPLDRRVSAAVSLTTSAAYSAHVAEGVDKVANNEFLCLTGGQPGAMHVASPKSAFVHLIAMRPPDVASLSRSGTAVIWSPRSNIALYGATAPVTLFHALGAQTIALSTDWTTSGSMNLLRELRCADSFNRRHLGGRFTDQQLWTMVTSGAAQALRLEDQIGSLAPGLLADIAVYDGRGRENAYRAVIDADPQHVLLVLRGGVALFGETPVMDVLKQTTMQCEALPDGVCGQTRTVCLDEKLGASLSTLIDANTSSYPLFFCSPPPDEPTCEPLRPADQWGCGRYPLDDGVADADGDGVPDYADNCPNVFNPVTPLDGAYAEVPTACLQADFDADGVGDACDELPFRPK